MKMIPLKCHCGVVQGEMKQVSPGDGQRVVCYCDDCQAFAQHMARTESILDRHGGTDLFQVTPSQITITKGAEQIRCLHLKPKGLFRWYTACCQTPIGNTLSAQFPFVGVVHSFMDNAETREQDLGPVRFYVHGRFAKGASDVPQLHERFPSAMMAKTVLKMFLRRVQGMHQPSPFFDRAGKPVAEPELLATKKPL